MARRHRSRMRAAMFTPLGVTPLLLGCGTTTGMLLDRGAGDAAVDADGAVLGDASIRSTQTRLAASDNGACAVTAGGALRCWGENPDGAVVPGAPSVLPSPVVVWPTHSWTAVGGASGHCALDTDGGMWCWGPGDAVPGSPLAAPLTRVPSPGAPFGSAAVGRDHHAVVTIEGALYTWGANDHGQLGTGDSTPRSSPVQVPGVWQAVAAGWNHTCAIDTTGAVYCWGAGEQGQLGAGAVVSLASPSKVAVAEAVQVAAGGNDSCVVVGSGALYCWGENVYGELGVGDTSVHPTPAQAAGTFRSVAVGGGTTCAITTVGTLACMGSFGQAQAQPNQSQLPRTYDSAGDWSEVAAGVSHACGVRLDASVFCLGWNFDGQLGSDDAGTYSGAAVPVRF